jgi:hypothetical protein
MDETRLNGKREKDFDIVCLTSKMRIEIQFCRHCPKTEGARDLESLWLN